MEPTQTQSVQQNQKKDVAEIDPKEKDAAEADSNVVNLAPIDQPLLDVPADVDGADLNVAAVLLPEPNAAIRAHHVFQFLD